MQKHLFRQKGKPRKKLVGALTWSVKILFLLLSTYRLFIFSFSVAFCNFLCYIGNLYERGMIAMMTIEGLIAVVSLVLTAFGLGYSIRSNDKSQK